jgi:hypothetical protein
VIHRRAEQGLAGCSARCTAASMVASIPEASATGVPPVGATASTSRPASRMGIAWRWMAVGTVQPMPASVACRPAGHLGCDCSCWKERSGGGTLPPMTLMRCRLRSTLSACVFVAAAQRTSMFVAAAHDPKRLLRRDTSSALVHDPLLTSAGSFVAGSTGAWPTVADAPTAAGELEGAAGLRLYCTPVHRDEKTSRSMVAAKLVVGWQLEADWRALHTGAAAPGAVPPAATLAARAPLRPHARGQHGLSRAVQAACSHAVVSSSMICPMSSTPCPCLVQVLLT